MIIVTNLKGRFMFLVWRDSRSAAYRFCHEAAVPPKGERAAHHCNTGHHPFKPRGVFVLTVGYVAMFVLAFCDNPLSSWMLSMSLTNPSDISILQSDKFLTPPADMLQRRSCSLKSQ